jgi:hypothetical protein
MKTACAALLLCLHPQNPPEPTLPPADELLAGFRALDADKRRTVVRNLERRLLLEPYEPLQRIVSMARGMESYPPLQPPVFHDPQVVAPGVAGPRKLIGPDAPAHAAARAAFPEPAFLDDLEVAVRYDWAAGKAARTREQLPDEALFANIARGFPPGADHAVARIVALLDQDPEQRALARWFEHLYADLDGNVFDGITLYRAWYSGRQVQVPDVDAIPFAEQILKTRSFRSPIPADRRRDRLYQKIQEAALEHRKYRTLRQAAAAAFVSADPELDPVYRPLVARCHYLWATVGWKPEALAQVLAEARDRGALLDEVDRKVTRDPAAHEVGENAKKELEAMARFLRELAAFELQRARG